MKPRIGQKNKLTRRWARRGTRPRAPHATSAPNGPISSARRDLSREGERRRAGHALVRHRRHGGAPHRDQCRRRSRRPCGADRRSGRLALDAQAGDPRSPQHHRPGAAATIARVEPGGECLSNSCATTGCANRIFKSYEDIVALCCQAWNGDLIDQPWKIMSLGMRKWAHGFLINDRWYNSIPQDTLYRARWHYRRMGR